MDFNQGDMMSKTTPAAAEVSVRKLNKGIDGNTFCKILSSTPAK